MEVVMEPMSREELKSAMADGRKFCWATLYERQDFMVRLSPMHVRPVREITNESDHHHRSIGG
jgi:hypothetical protein